MSRDRVEEIRKEYSHLIGVSEDCANVVFLLDQLETAQERERVLREALAGTMGFLKPIPEGHVYL